MNHHQEPDEQQTTVSHSVSPSHSPSQTASQQVQTLSQRYATVRDWTVELCRPLQTEDFVVQPIEDVSPPKWHLGHTAWFFENFILHPHVSGYERFNEQFNWFFNSYYESQGPRIQRTNRGNMTRPSVKSIMQYREHIDQYMQILLEGISTHDQCETIRSLVETGLHHEQQHQELLLTDIKYILGTNPLYPVFQDEKASQNTPARVLQFCEISEGLYDIGFKPQQKENERCLDDDFCEHDLSNDDFCWDNELSCHPHYLQGYEIADRLVTCGEYLDFMQDGGYERFELWQMDGIGWVRSLEVPAPLYWHQLHGDWFQYTLGGLKEIDPAVPVTHVSWYEADAFARWADARLPTEQEWEVACGALCPEIPAAGNWVESKSFHPQPAADHGDTQLFGHAWEWTASAYLPYPRYPRPAGALGEYNGKFMINQMVLRGGSCATPVSHIRSTYRNFFQPEKRWQFTGIRLTRDVSS